MRTLMKSLLLLLSMTLAVSCGNDDEMMSQSCSDGIQNGTETGIDCGGDCNACETTVAEDMANVQQTMEDMVSCVQEMSDARATSEFLKNFLGVSDGYILNEDWVDDVFTGLEDVIDFEKIENDKRFDLAYHAGTHIYDAETVTWQKINDVNDRVVLRFPSSPTATTNNVEFVLDVFTDELVEIDGEILSLPKTLHTLVNVDGTKAFEITVDKVTYASNTGYQLPVELDATLFMDPMTLSINVDRLSTTSYEMGVTFDNGMLCDVGVTAQLTLTDDDFENLDENSFETAAVQVNLGQLSFRTLGNLADLIAIDDPTDAQVNSLADVDLFFQDLKIGDIEINNAMETILIFYKDETSEDMENYLTDLEDILADFFG